MKRLHITVILFFVSSLLADVRRTEDLTVLQLQQALLGKRFVDLRMLLRRESRIGQAFRMKGARPFIGMKKGVEHRAEVSLRKRFFM
jgi:hypothetical protein